MESWPLVFKTWFQATYIPIFWKSLGQSRLSMIQPTKQYLAILDLVPMKLFRKNGLE